MVVQDPAVRRALRDLYLPGWYDYLAMTMAGVRPWAPTNDPAVEAEATAEAAAVAESAAASGGGFAEHLDEAPVLLALFVDLSVLAAVDRDHERYSFAGGASVYPFAWNLLLAARAEGLGGVITTMAIRREDEVKALLHAPDDVALAAVIALGHPVRQPRRLTRGRGRRASRRSTRSTAGRSAAESAGRSAQWRPGGPRSGPRRSCRTPACGCSRRRSAGPRPGR